MSRCRARPVVRRPAVSASVAVALVKRRSRPIGVASAPGWPSCAARSRTCRPPATSSARNASAARCRRSRSPATPTPASRRCSTGSPAPACWSRTSCSPPSTRPFAGPQTSDGRAYTLTDTVGFVRHLPHQLVEAFRSTLEEVAQADLIVHVVDGSDTDPFAQLVAVREVLNDIDARRVPELVVINKVDVADPEIVDAVTRAEQRRGNRVVALSARTGVGRRRADRGSRRPRAARRRVHRRAACRSRTVGWWRGCTSSATCSTRSTPARAPTSRRRCRRGVAGELASWLN